MKQTVTGLFETIDQAQHAQEALLQCGFHASDIELPVHESGVLAGIERLVGSFFSSTGDGRSNPGASPEPVRPSGNVLIGVRVADEAHADLASNTLRGNDALEVAVRGGNWTWAATDADPVAREHSALDELGLANLADAMHRRLAQAADDNASDVQPGGASDAAQGATDTPAQPSRPVNDAEATVLASASAPGAGAVMGAPAPRATQPTQPAEVAAPRIPDEFIEYEEDSHDHRASDAPDRPVTGQPPTLH
ncbi:hypothetical protein LMG28688_06424 [Paraburkholderia caffeinitolerans]|uniref:Uncharacterized protein n=1 Tax=Paraburkholderia caffeinitolerans TaxID=1723730 RepID=A0A6J5GVA7_9BURK|nr:hypothetical protein [Paraburkholderia caffeinitolerans]CAB3806857.1 hypothetical protein LMG28688_06424 [Paraburkholderia caffeinitolerans]